MSNAPEDAQEAMDRRRFVRRMAGTAVAGAALGATATGAGFLWATRIERGSLQYLGARRTGGPAIQGPPIIPVRINRNGLLEGVPELGEGPIHHSLSWYAWCSRQGAPGLDPDYTTDNVFRYSQTPQKLAAHESELGAPAWYAPYLDQPVRADHFTQAWQGAPVRWRSEGQEQNNVLSAIVMKVDPGTIQGLPDGFADDGFLAYDAVCPHFCCLSGYQESLVPKKRGVFDSIFCTCHDSVFDPRDIRLYHFPPDGGEDRGEA